MLHHEEPPRQAAAKTKTVGVVNNDPDVLALLRRLLEEERYRALRRSYRVVVCQGSERAYEVVGAALPDLVILDEPRGDLSARDALNLIKRDPTTAGIPVVVCARPSPELWAAEPRLQERGCELLLKPFTLDDLLDAAERVTSREQATID